MISPEIKKGINPKETSTEKLPKTQESKRLPDFSEIQKELEVETGAGVEAGHKLLGNLETQEQADIKFPPELKAQFAEIQKGAEGKLRRLDVSLGQMKKNFLSVVNFITGGVLEKMRRNPSEKNKFFTGFYVSQNNLGIGAKERNKLESQISMDKISKLARDAGSYLADKIQNNNVVLIGEIHTHETIEKRAVADFLNQAKIAGTTHVGLEIPEYYQEAVDRFMATGKFDEADNPADYNQVDEYHRLFREQLVAPKEATQEGPEYNETGTPIVSKAAGQTDEMFSFERKMRKNYLFQNHLDKDFRLLQGIRESGLTPVCLDANATYGTSQELDNGFEAVGRGEMNMVNLIAKEKELEGQRDLFMTKKIQSVVAGGGKMLAVLGNNHVAREGMAGRQNVADLLGKTNLRTFSINLDRDCDADPELSYIRQEQAQPSDSSVNSVLFSAIGKNKALKDRSIGFDLDNNITGQNTPVPYDGYIRLNKAI